MPAPTSPTVRRRRLAAELRRLRDVLDLTLEEVADRLNWSASKLSRIETAKSGAKIADVRRLLHLYQITGPQADDLVSLAREAERKGWWEAYSDTFPEEVSAQIGLEAEASRAVQWQAQVVPGLLQTEAYAEQTVLGHQPALARPPSQVKARVVSRLQRQEVLSREHPLVLTAILDESILWRGYGPAEVMHEQLMKLVRVSELPNVDVLVRPFAAANPPPTVPPFTYLDFEESFHAVVFVELLNGGVYIENDLDTYRYSRVLDSLHDQALNQSDSRDLITQIAKNHWQTR